MCRKDRFAVNCFRLIKRLTELAEIPPRYSQASFSLRAPCLTVADLAPSVESHCCLVDVVFIILCADGDERKSRGPSVLQYKR